MNEQMIECNDKFDKIENKQLKLHRIVERRDKRNKFLLKILTGLLVAYSIILAVRFY